MSDVYVSVIIPTYNDWTRLSLCLQALAGQRFPQAQFEILIVNNNPADPPPAGFWVPCNGRIITEAKAGSYAARNAALKIARGEIIAFTDSDCIPDQNWIQNAVAYFRQQPTCSRIAGNISIFPNGLKPTATDLYNSIFEFPQLHYIQHSGTSVTANLFTYKKVFDEVGLFNEKLFSLGDLEWGKQAHKAGFQIHFVENVVVKHPSRSFTELIKKVKRIGGGQATFKQRSAFRSFLSCLNDARPRLYIAAQIYRYGRHLNPVEKLKVLLLRYYLLTVRAAEKFRVLQGKQPERA